MTQYCKRTGAIDALQWDGSVGEGPNSASALHAFTDGVIELQADAEGTNWLILPLGAEVNIAPGMWVVKTAPDTFQAMSPEAFFAAYAELKP